MHMCRHMHAMVHVWRPEVDFCGLVFLFHLSVGSGYQVQDIRLSWQVSSAADQCCWAYLMPL